MGRSAVDVIEVAVSWGVHRRGAWGGGEGAAGAPGRPCYPGRAVLRQGPAPTAPPGGEGFRFRARWRSGCSVTVLSTAGEGVCEQAGSRGVPPVPHSPIRSSRALPWLPAGGLCAPRWLRRFSQGAHSAQLASREYGELSSSPRKSLDSQGFPLPSCLFSAPQGVTPTGGGRPGLGTGGWTCRVTREL